MKYMRVKKRNGSTEDVSFDKVIKRIQTLCEMEPVLETIEPVEIAQKVCLHIYDGVYTSELDELAAELCTQKSVSNMEYGTLASRIIISNNQKCTSPSFSETIAILYQNGGHSSSPLISKEVYQFVMENKNKLNGSIVYSRDYTYDYFAFKTLEKSYLLRVNGKVVERIQHMFMRVSCGLHYDNIKQCIETYDLLSQKYFTHATPTLFHSGTPNPQLLSCFLLGVEDSVQGIYKAVSDCALISKWAGGIGLHIHDIRAENSPIESTNGKSNGLVPMLKVFNDVARHINQCFTPETIVYGENGPIKMVDCKVGDRLYTIDGTLKPILEVAVNNIDKPILSIKSSISSEPVSVTSEHQLYVLKSLDSDPQYISASDLQVGHYMGLPIALDTNSSGYISNGIAWYPIETIDTINYSGDVYDFNMMDNHNYVTKIGIVHNSGKRNGSFAMYLEPHHPDVLGFLEAKKNHGDENARARDLFYAMWISDLFMERVKSNQMWSLLCPNKCKGLSDVYGQDYKDLYTSYERDPKNIVKQVPAMDIWKEICKSQMETGTPYIGYKDAVNKKSNQQHYGTIKSSNLCVAPETLILTENGHIPIETLKDQQVNIWNGFEWSNVEVKQTGINQPLVRVSLSDGTSLECTPEHKFHVLNENYKEIVVMAKDLEKDTKLIKCNYPIINTNKELKSAYTNGFFSGDGTVSKSNHEVTICKFKALENRAYCKRHINYQVDNEISEKCQGQSYLDNKLVCLYHEKINLLEHLDYVSHGEIINNRLTVTLPKYLEEKYFVPINYSLKSKLEWFAGYCDADGCITNNGTNQSLQIVSIYPEFLRNIKYMLQTCGINPKISKQKNAGYRSLPDGKGGHKNYATKPAERLLISSGDLQILLENGFSPKRLIINKRKIQRNATHFVKIVDLVNNNRIADTYCFTEPKRHTGIFNGIITGQCIEINEYSDSNEYACCTLASISLPSFIEDFDKSTIKSVEIYSKSNCKFCDYSKKFLKSYGLEYKEIVLDDPEERGEFFEKLNANSCEGDSCSINDIRFKSVPQIFINGTHIGGFSELYRYFKPTYNYKKLAEITKVVTNNLNKVIDLNYYPVPETRLSNLRHRPIGIGVQGLADVYARYHLAFDSEEAKEINKKIFATIYYAALQKSNELAIEHREKVLEVQMNPNSKPLVQIFHEEITAPSHPGAYSTFSGSPISKGQFQFDLWGIEPIRDADGFQLDWETLRKNIMVHGIRNSLLTASMPTASTSQILGNNECIEPFTSNMYSRGTLAGQFIVINKYLLDSLDRIGIWNDDLKDTIIINNGSIQQIKEVPDVIRETYKIAWDLSMKSLIDQSADRGAYICQTQSLNLWIEDPDLNKLTSMHFYSWQKGLKTGIYYLRRRAVSKAQTFSIDASKTVNQNKKVVEEEGCLSCSA